MRLDTIPKLVTDGGIDSPARSRKSAKRHKGDTSSSPSRGHQTSPMRGTLEFPTLPTLASSMSASVRPVKYDLEDISGLATRESTRSRGRPNYDMFTVDFGQNELESDTSMVRNKSDPLMRASRSREGSRSPWRSAQVQSEVKTQENALVLPSLQPNLSKVQQVEMAVNPSPTKSSKRRRRRSSRQKLGADDVPASAAKQPHFLYDRLAGFPEYNVSSEAESDKQGHHYHQHAHSVSAVEGQAAVAGFGLPGEIRTPASIARRHYSVRLPDAHKRIDWDAYRIDDLEKIENKQENATAFFSSLAYDEAQFDRNSVRYKTMPAGSRSKRRAQRKSGIPRPAAEHSRTSSHSQALTALGEKPGEAASPGETLSRKSMRRRWENRFLDAETETETESEQAALYDDMSSSQRRTSTKPRTRRHGRQEHHQYIPTTVPADEQDIGGSGGAGGGRWPEPRASTQRRPKAARQPKEPVTRVALTSDGPDLLTQPEQPLPATTSSRRQRRQANVSVPFNPNDTFYSDVMRADGAAAAAAATTKDARARRTATIECEEQLDLHGTTEARTSRVDGSAGARSHGRRRNSVERGREAESGSGATLYVPSSEEPGLSDGGQAEVSKARRSRRNSLAHARTKLSMEQTQRVAQRRSSIYLPADSPSPEPADKAADKRVTASSCLTDELWLKHMESRAREPPEVKDVAVIPPTRCSTRLEDSTFPHEIPDPDIIHSKTQTVDSDILGFKLRQILEGNTASGDEGSDEGPASSQQPRVAADRTNVSVTVSRAAERGPSEGRSAHFEPLMGPITAPPTPIFDICVAPTEEACDHLRVKEHDLRGQDDGYHSNENQTSNLSFTAVSDGDLSDDINRARLAEASGPLATTDSENAGQNPISKDNPSTKTNGSRSQEEEVKQVGQAEDRSVLTWRESEDDGSFYEELDLSDGGSAGSDDDDDVPTTYMQQLPMSDEELLRQMQVEHDEMMEDLELAMERIQEIQSNSIIIKIELRRITEVGKRLSAELDKKTAVIDAIDTRQKDFEKDENNPENVRKKHEATDQQIEEDLKKVAEFKQKSEQMVFYVDDLQGRKDDAEERYEQVMERQEERERELKELRQALKDARRELKTVRSMRNRFHKAVTKMRKGKARSTGQESAVITPILVGASRDSELIPARSHTTNKGKAQSCTCVLL